MVLVPGKMQGSTCGQAVLVGFVMPHVGPLTITGLCLVLVPGKIKGSANGVSINSWDALSLSLSRFTGCSGMLVLGVAGPSLIQVINWETAQHRLLSFPKVWQLLETHTANRCPSQKHIYHFASWDQSRPCTRPSPKVRLSAIPAVLVGVLGRQGTSTPTMRVSSPL